MNEKNMVLYKEKEFEDRIYILVIRKFLCPECKKFHVIKAIDLEQNSIFESYLGKAGFLEMGESDFVLYSVTNNFIKDDRKALTAENNDYEDLKLLVNKFQYEIYYQLKLGEDKK